MEKIYKHRQWSERFKQKTKRNSGIDIAPRIKQEQMTGTEGNTKEKKIQQDLLWTLGPEATYLITQSEYRTQPDKIELDNLFKLYDRNYSPKRNKKTTHEQVFGQNKQIRKHRKSNGRT